MRRTIAVITLALLAGSCLAVPEWTPAVQDDFNRRSLGTGWLVLRGDWHINADGQLQIQRQWPSHSFIMNTVSLRGKNVRAEFDFLIPNDEQRGTFAAFLQSGAMGWGGGGIDDRVGAEVNGVDPAEIQSGKWKPGPLDVTAGEMHHMIITLADGQYEVRVDDRVAASGQAPQGRSLVNSGLQFNAVRGARVDNLKILTAPMANPLPAINDATPEQNRSATVFAEKFYDAAKPDCGFQQALDALPPGGGVVILPKGEFLLRRFLEVRSHVTLMGQGPETVLKVIDVTGANVKSFEPRPDGTCVLTLEPGHDFRAGDAFSYGASWGHPINSKGPGRKGLRHMLGGGSAAENRLLVLSVEGDTLTVNAAPADAKKGARIIHFFPPVCSYESEFAQVKDLTIHGPEKNPAGGSGGFCTNPVTFGVTSNPRFTRLVIRDFPADGISAQGCDDGRAFDCTISGTAQGMHPGTSTQRFMAARNYAVDNRSTGLFFCWYNSQGVYFRNWLKNFTGYPDAGDVFNTIACNRLTDGMRITVGYNGCFLANDMPSLTLFGDNRGKPHEDSVLGPNGRSYDVPPRYFTIAQNTIDTITLYKYAQGNVFAANRAHDGTPTKLDYRSTKDLPLEGQPEKNIIANDAEVIPLPGLPGPITRSEPMPPPSLPEPILDGRDFYDPADPTCGFQKALDQLAGKGGTLRLPGGRYALKAALRIPSNVTLTGYGTGTVLLSAGLMDGAALLDVKQASDVTIRDMAIEGDWGVHGFCLFGAVSVTESERISLLELDIRGWGRVARTSETGHGIAIDVLRSSNVAIRDCRVVQCGAAYSLTNNDGLICESSSALNCQWGFQVAGCKNAVLAGNIAARNNTYGYCLHESDALIAACNASNNALGIRILGKNVTAAGNTTSGNRLAGILLLNHASDARILYNNCGDEQLYATQLVGILEQEGATNNVIRHNVTATMATRRGHENDPSLVANGKGTVVEGNWTETILPSNDSIEAIEWMKRNEP